MAGGRRPTAMAATQRSHSRLSGVTSLPVFSWFFCPSALPSFGILEPVTFTGSFQDVAAMCQAIQGGSYQTEMKTELSRFFWNSLRRYAADYCCTIIVTRTQGLNESRSYGPFTKLGSDHARFALAMHWHPHTPEERILTVIKHQFGPIGKQFHLQFENNQATLKAVEKDHYQRPAKSAPTYQATKTARTLVALTFTPQELEVVRAIEEMAQSGVPAKDLHQKLTHTGHAHTLLEAVAAKLKLCEKNEQARAQKNQALVQHLLKPAHTTVAA